ncbi:MAG: BadF-type ATPase [Devosia sp.]|uniref:N-acetylglucosamine kinase n=1 Tax=Devosia sp. TaxID=1871048 RepID=UPI00260FB06D|nr:BadF/BadG/BcrA/BcrD ATPase family protein [Devosia sp.]MDB5586561.1 BadF-type ATPase [Devosia sp.]
MPTFLGVDIGGTASRWALVDENSAVIARGTTDGATGHAFNPIERERLLATLSTIAEAVREFSPVSACLGITGLGQGAHDPVRNMVTALLGIEPPAIQLGDDMELAFRATFAPGTGHLISAGTGSIGLHLTTEGKLIRVGGRGLLIDDAGSGTWIALKALDQLYRRIDETGDPADAAILATELYAEMGGEGWDHSRSFVYGSDRGRIGTLAQAVARAATKGDVIATDILARAVVELARLASALIARTGPLPVAFIGGIITLHPSIKPALEKALPHAVVSFPQIDAAAHAAQWARQNSQETETSQ